MGDYLLTRQLPIEVRELDPPACDEDAGAKPRKSQRRRFSFVGATEGGVQTPWGLEYLRMGGVRLDRYMSNPVVLDGHDRKSARSVVGRATVRCEGKQLVFDDVEFANTKLARDIEQLVADGFVRAVSIGFLPSHEHTRDLHAGEVDGDGEDAIHGPGTVISQAELIELSMVPVGADEHALRRSFYEARRKPMEQHEETGALAGASAEDGAGPGEDQIPPAPQGIPVTREQLLALVPRGLEHAAERCVLEGMTLERARAALLVEHARRHPPVGTPEPPERTTPPRRASESAPRAKAGGVGAISGMSLDEIKRALTGS